MLVPYLIGFILALSVGTFAMLVSLDRDRAFYPTVLIVVASYYVLFAIMGGDQRELIENLLIAVVFVIVASMGFKRSSWLIVAALAAHGLFDFVHGFIMSNRGMPPWWPAFCGSYDVTAAGFLAWALHRSPSLSRPRDRSLP